LVPQHLELKVLEVQEREAQPLVQGLPLLEELPLAPQLLLVL